MDIFIKIVFIFSNFLYNYIIIFLFDHVIKKFVISKLNWNIE